jgi:hypothetical protein
MRKKAKKILLKKRREERKTSHRGILKSRYSEMASKKILGRMELDKYEKMRVDITNTYKGIGECPYFPCEARGEIPTRDHYHSLAVLYNQLL